MDSTTSQGSKTVTEITVGMRVLVDITQGEAEGVVVALRDGQLWKPPAGRFSIGVRTERWGLTWLKPREVTALEVAS